MLGESSPDRNVSQRGLLRALAPSLGESMAATGGSTLGFRDAPATLSLKLKLCSKGLGSNSNLLDEDCC